MANLLSIGCPFLQIYRLNPTIHTPSGNVKRSLKFSLSSQPWWQRYPTASPHEWMNRFITASKKRIKNRKKSEKSPQNGHTTTNNDWSPPPNNPTKYQLNIMNRWGLKPQDQKHETAEVITSSPRCGRWCTKTRSVCSPLRDLIIVISSICWSNFFCVCVWDCGTCFKTFAANVGVL